MKRTSHGSGPPRPTNDAETAAAPETRETSITRIPKRMRLSGRILERRRRGWREAENEGTKSVMTIDDGSGRLFLVMHHKEPDVPAGTRVVASISAVLIETETTTTASGIPSLREQRVFLEAERIAIGGRKAPRRYIPEDLMVAAGCGCRRRLDEIDERRCEHHRAVGGWKSPGEPVIVYENEVHAMEEYRALRSDAHLGCGTIDCPYRNDGKGGKDGFCSACATRRSRREERQDEDDEPAF